MQGRSPGNTLLIGIESSERLDQWRIGVPNQETGRLCKGLVQWLPGSGKCTCLTGSSGQAEVQVNKLKSIKRQMYGRASSFELLRRGMILSTPLYHQNWRRTAYSGISSQSTQGRCCNHVRKTQATRFRSPERFIWNSRWRWSLLPIFLFGSKRLLFNNVNVVCPSCSGGSKTLFFQTSNNYCIGFAVASNIFLRIIQNFFIDLNLIFFIVLNLINKKKLDRQSVEATIRNEYNTLPAWYGGVLYDHLNTKVINGFLHYLQLSSQLNAFKDFGLP